MKIKTRRRRFHQELALPVFLVCVAQGAVFGIEMAISSDVLTGPMRWLAPYAARHLYISSQLLIAVGLGLWAMKFDWPLAFGVIELGVASGMCRVAARTLSDGGITPAAAAVGALLLVVAAMDSFSKSINETAARLAARAKGDLITLTWEQRLSLWLMVRFGVDELPYVDGNEVGTVNIAALRN